MFPFQLNNKIKSKERLTNFQWFQDTEPYRKLGGMKWVRQNWQTRIMKLKSWGIGWNNESFSTYHIQPEYNAAKED